MTCCAFRNCVSYRAGRRVRAWKIWISDVAAVLRNGATTCRNQKQTTDAESETKKTVCCFKVSKLKSSKSEKLISLMFID